MKDKRYEFNKEKHLHMLDGKALTGCTTVLSVIAKPALIPWAVKTCADFILKALEDKKEITPSVVEEAKKQHRLTKEKAGDWGTEVHSWVERWIMAQIVGDKSQEPHRPENDLKWQACQHFVKWATDNKVTFKESEKNVYSEKMWLGGIVDVVCEIDGKTWIADIKTGSGIYPEHFWQMAAYDMCLEEMGLYPEMTGHIVLNLKKDGTFDERRSVSNEDNKQAFKAALTIYRVQEKIKNQVIK